ncbi:helix-turn-helix domain-containing protein [Variovorax atrisoli]|uniref:helix-turn-helix domain-containing protein n=1 Tax=Variovorax atrisoli TaxID=3394203 RepID=UPI004040118C
MPSPSPSLAGDPVLVALGAAIRRARKARGLSQESLAQESSLERAYMSSVERGLQNPSVYKLVQLARVLGLPLSELIADAGL